MSAVPVAGWETSVVLQELGKAIAVSFAYTLASWYLLPRREFHGSPLYNWLSCLPIQLVAFPACVALCVASRPETQALGEWLVAPWSELDGVFERRYLLLIFGYLTKDVGLYALGGKMDAMYWAHHVLCWTIIVGFFYTNLVCIFIVGGSAMEFGGASQTLHLLSPESEVFDVVHVVTMTLSHVVACGLAAYYVVLPLAPLAIRAAFGAVVFGLSFERQKYAMQLHAKFAEKKKKA